MKRHPTLVRLAALTCLVGILASSFGCYTPAQFYVPRFPVIPKPERPQLQNIPGAELSKMTLESQNAVISNFNHLMDYARKLEVGIDEYNKFAEGKNAQFSPSIAKRDVAPIPAEPMVGPVIPVEVWDGKTPFTKPNPQWDGKSQFTK